MLLEIKIATAVATRMSRTIMPMPVAACSGRWYSGISLAADPRNRQTGDRIHKNIA